MHEKRGKQQTNIINETITKRKQYKMLADAVGSKLCTGCAKKKDTVTLSHNFRLNYLNSTFQAGM